MPFDPAEYSRRYRQKNREAISRRRAELRREKLAREGPDGERARNLRVCHGQDYAEVLAEMWDEQGGLCYLCGDELVSDKVTFDHDHACCRPSRSCKACRRGLACHRCNRLIGQVQDSPELLRRIADNLELRTQEARLRIAAKPTQLSMVIES